MIKNLLDADENPPPDTRVIIEETIIQPPTANPEAQNAVPFERAASPKNNFEIPSTAKNFNANDDFDAARNAKTIDGEIVQPSLEQALFQTEYQPETTAETMRKSGLAYAAAITLFGAVVFMMIIGWGADLLLGSSPWGIVGGIVLGALVGFVQLFRLSSQIIENKD